MRSVPLLFFFGLALTFALFGSLLFPFFPLNAFAPFLAIVFYVAPFSKALWISCGCGLILDLLSSEFHFGVHALTWIATTALLFHQKRHFFEEKPVAFSIFTAVISSVSTIFQLIFIPLFLVYIWSKRNPDKAEYRPLGIISPTLNFLVVMGFVGTCLCP